MAKFIDESVQCFSRHDLQPAVAMKLITFRQERRIAFGQES
jgi:hypothetical protein